MPVRTSPDCTTNLRQERGIPSEGCPHGHIGFWGFTCPPPRNPALVLVPWSLPPAYWLAAPLSAGLAGAEGIQRSCSSRVVWGSMEGEGELT